MTGNIPTDRFILPVLTMHTVRLGQRVEVYAHPDVAPVPHQGATGVVRRLPPEPRAVAGVAIDQYGGRIAEIPLYNLHPTDRKESR